MNTNYSQQIVANLEKKGESKDYIIGFLQATIDGLRHITDAKDILAYIKRSVEHTQS
jgi:hypothetical protein